MSYPCDNITVTELLTSGSTQSRYLDTNKILMFTDDQGNNASANSSVLYAKWLGGRPPVTEIECTETPAAILALATGGEFITLTKTTATGGQTIYVNAAHITGLSDETTYREFTLDAPPGKYRFNVTESISAIQTAMGGTTPGGTYLVDATTTGITAFATGGQANATQLVAGFNNVTVCATALDSVKLPVAAADGYCVVKNSTANAIALYPSSGSSGDAIDSAAADAYIIVPPGATIEARAIDGTTWETGSESVNVHSPSGQAAAYISAQDPGIADVVTNIYIAGAVGSRTHTLNDPGADSNFVMSEGAQTLNGAMTLGGGNGLASNVAGGMATFMVVAAQDAVTDSGACSVANYYTTLTTTGAAIPTLADGTIVGQKKKIQMIVDAGDAVLTPANLSGGTTITYADVGDTAELVWDGTNWVAVALYNIVDGATAPVLA